jgi:chromosome segregation ATPase
MIIVENKDQDVASKKETLNALAVSINNIKFEIKSIEDTKNIKQAELNDIFTRIDFAMEDLVHQENLLGSVIDDNNSQIQKLSLEISELENKKSEVINELLALEKEISSKKESIVTDLASYTDTHSKKLKSLKQDIKALEEEKTKLNDFVEVLSIDTSDSGVILENIKAEIDLLSAQLDEKTKEYNLLDDKMFEIQSYMDKSSKKIETNTNKIKDLEETISSLSLEVEGLEKTKSTYLSEVAKFLEEREQLNREKLAFQTERQKLQGREEFIREKYQLAGVAFN